MLNACNIKMLQRSCGGLWYNGIFHECANLKRWLNCREVRGFFNYLIFYVNLVIKPMNPRREPFNFMPACPVRANLPKISCILGPY